MEKKLADYRARQERSAKIEKYKNQVKKCLHFLIPKSSKNQENTEYQEVRNENTASESCIVRKRKMDIAPEKENLIINDDVVSIDSDVSVDDSIMCCTWLKLTYYILCFILWVTIYVIFIKLEFGAVYFILSALILMYINTRTGPKKQGEISAYSVFNKDCESIDGTLDAEQLQRELMLGPLGIR